MLNLVVLSVPGKTMLILSQFRGNSVVRFRVLDPLMKVYETPGRLLVQGYVE